MKALCFFRCRINLGIMILALFSSSLSYSSKIPLVLSPDLLNQSPSQELALKGRWNQGPVFASAISGSYLYFGSAGTVRVVEVIKDLTGKAIEWREISSISTEGVVRDMLVVDHSLYIADGSGWLRIIDVKNPQKPKLSGTLHLGGEVKAIYYENNKIYIAAGWNGVHIIDVIDDVSPTLIHSYKSTGYALDVVVKNSHVFIAAGRKGLQIVDATDPYNPKTLGTHKISGRAAGIDADDAHAYVVNMDDASPSLTIFDVTNKGMPKLIAAEPLRYGAERVRVEGHFVYVAGVANDAGLIVVDVSNPRKPMKVGSWFDTTCSESVSIDNNIAYLAHGDQGLEILDLSDPSTPFVTEHFSAAGHVRAVGIKGQIAFLANGYKGVKIVDISDSGNIKTLSELKTYRALDIDVVGDYAHVADDWAGYKLVDISNPKAPKLISSFDTPGYAEGLHATERFVYIATGEGGLRILDLLSPVSPQEISSVKLDGYAYGVFVQGSYAYLAAGKGGLVVIDVSNPSAPKIMSTFKTKDEKFEVRGVVIKDNHALLAAGYSGFSIVDISNRRKVKEVGHFKTSKRANHVSENGNLAYVLDSNEVKVIDISKFDAPRLLTSHDLPANAAKIHVVANKVFVAGMESGLIIFEL
jgi:hypothetical protein